MFSPWRYNIDHAARALLDAEGWSAPDDDKLPTAGEVVHDYLAPLARTAALAPLIDPNEHSCGTVRPHGHRELAQPEPDFYAIGAKSYGRAPNFLMATGYEQARSVAAALAGDMLAADDVQLELPETGLCSVDFAREDAVGATAKACCGGPPMVNTSACCRRDEVKKAEGKAGCGCSAAATTPLASSS